MSIPAPAARRFVLGGLLACAITFAPAVTAPLDSPVSGGSAWASPASGSASPDARPAKDQLRPVVTDQVSIPLVAPTGASSTATAAARLVSTPEFALPRASTVVGASWSGELSPNAVVEVRSRDLNGSSPARWSPWAELPRQEGAPSSSAPFVVLGTHAQLRARGAGDIPMRAVVIDSGESAADESVSREASREASRQAGPQEFASDASRPAIMSRRQWGADESMRRDDPSYGQALMTVIHHTAGANGYSAESVPGILRGIYAYHVKTNGWDDIGYNVLVDRFGRAWEGRAGGVDKAVVGAHAQGVNSSSFGISAIGDFSGATPSSQMLGAMKVVVAWKMSLHGVPATGTVTVGGTAYNRISGHRDIKGNSTGCPGAAMYRQFGSIRSDVAARIGRQSKITGTRSWSPDRQGDLLDHTGTGAARAALGQLPTPVAAGRTIGRGWNVLENIVLTEDLTGDGRPDIIARDPAANNLRVYHGDGRGGFAGMSTGGGGWHNTTDLVAAGDRTGDGRADLIAIRRDGAIVLYAGDGHGWFSAGRVIGSGAGYFRSWTALTDVEGGRAELLAIRKSDNALVRWRTALDGSLSPLSVVSTGWGSISQVVGARDLDGDGSTLDLIARENEGRMRTYYSQGPALLSRYNFWGRGWQALDHLGAGVDWDGDGHTDVVARQRSGGDLVFYRGSGARDFNGGAIPVHTIPGATAVTLLGDIDGDGRGDVVARDGSGDLYALRGTPSGFAVVRKIGTGWNIFSRIAAGADYTRDGVPDILAMTPGGEIRVYALSPTWSYAWISVIETDAKGMRDVAGVGSINADFNSDVVTLRASDGALVLWRGTGPGALGESVVIATGRSDLRSIEGVGDLNGDGQNDVLARDGEGGGWLFPGTGTGLAGRGLPVTVP